MVEWIVEVHLAPHNRAPEVYVVLPPFVAYVVGPCEVVTHEGRLWIISKGESTLDSNALNGARLGLEWERHPKGRHIDCVGRRPSVGDFPEKLMPAAFLEAGEKILVSSNMAFCAGISKAASV